MKLTGSMVGPPAIGTHNRSWAIAASLTVEVCEGSLSQK